MQNFAGMRAALRRAPALGASLLSAALTFFSGLGQASVGVAVGDAGAAAEPSYTYNAVTGVAATLAAGRSPTRFGVSHSGAASYRIPLWTPPGIGELEVALALVYDSRGGNGTLGQGWSLAGLSAITRCNRTVAQDGAARGVTATTDDRFCLDGQQLKLVSGTYGSAGSVYATEIESYARIVANGTSGNGPLSFTLTTRNGLVHEYGGTTDARVQAGATATVRTWALSRIRDRAAGSDGNSIEFRYYNDAQATAYTNGTHRIATIAYPRTVTGQGPFYEVRFGYSARPADDVPVGYLAGSLLREPNRLDTIAIHAVGQAAPIKSYNLGYESSTTTGRLRLNTVQECSASSCLRPTTVSYQYGLPGWQALRETALTMATGVSPTVGDFDGDGRSDVLYAVSAGSGKFAWSILRGATTGFLTPFSTGLVTTTTTSQILTGDFLGLGRPQFLVQQGGLWSIAGYVGGAFAVASTGRVPQGESGAADFDGDGLADLVGVTSTTPQTVYVRRNTTTPVAGSLAVQFAGSTLGVWTVPDTRKLKPVTNQRVPDLNGDGRADILIQSTNKLERLAKGYITPMLSNGFGAAFTQAPERQVALDSMLATADWNADGCTDVMQVSRVWVSDCAGSLTELRLTITPPTGDGLYTVMPADWNADGRTDLLYVDAATNDWYVIRSTGEGAAAPVSTGVDAPRGSAWFVHDADGDGLVDLGERAPDARIAYRLHADPGKPPDLAVAFTDGFGIQQRPTYVSIARAAHERQSTATFPEADFQGPLYVVSETLASDGTGGTYRNEFRYYGARRHLQGRGFEGFDAQRIVDTRNGLVTYDYAQRAFPYTGTHVRRRVLQADDATPVSEWSAALAQRSGGGTGFEQRTFAYTVTTTLRSYEFDGSLKGTPVTETITSYSYGDAYGNATQVQTSTTDKDPTSPFVGSVWQSVATYGYLNDATAWCLGLPASSTVTTTAPGQPALTRTASFVGDGVTCRISQQILEPGSAALKVTTTYGYDACGNLGSLRVAGASPGGTALPARTTSFDYGARCQLPETITNALGQATRIEYRYDFGVPTRWVDPNGLATVWQHDELGRRTLETRPDQTRTAWSYESCGGGACWGTSDLRFVVYQNDLGSDQAPVRASQSFFDGFERLRSAQYQRAGGTWTEIDYSYDSFGRRTVESRPYSTSSNGHRRTEFDALGRVRAVRDFDASGVAVRSSTLTPAGRTTIVTDPLGRSRTWVHDVAGRLRRVVDPAPGGTTRYDYDSHGGLVRIEDPLGALSTGAYDVRGFRTRWTDADAGTWTYATNSLGELVAWTNAQGQSAGASYDALGRLVSRTEPEGTSTYTWGASAAAWNIGRLQSRSGLGYGESYLYDAAGRLKTRTIVSDQTYQYDYAYGSTGALDTLTYPVSPVPTGQSGMRLKIRYQYSYGALARIDDVTLATPRVLWQRDATDDDGRPTREQVAGGATAIASTFEAATGRLLGRASGPGGSPARHQNLSYRWDAADNLLERRDVNQNLTETFTFDTLNRVTAATLNGVANLSVAYDATGNIRQKSGVGTYTYGNAARPHLLTAAGTETFAYDANGNVVSRGGLAQQWASFGLPTLLQKSGYQGQFSYGPDHQRWRQIATYQNGTETTHYVGSLLEKESTTSTGVTYWRHYVPTPGSASVVVSRNSNGTASTSYLLTDHLASTDAVLDGSGNLYGRQSFDAFGARRGSNWSSTTAPDWAGIANVTRQGFTAHEMLDNVGLVHLGGRVYDPGLGRFLSVDPVVGDLGDSQTVHPYAYVGNRPLSLVDPTGREAVSMCAAYCPAVAYSIARTALNFLFGGSSITEWHPGATAIPGQTAQSDDGICGPGTFSRVCSGSVLYMGVPNTRGDGPGTSTWGVGNEVDPYFDENLERFFVDLGLNAIDVLVLDTVHQVADGYHAAERGEYQDAVVIISLTACEVAKPCYAMKGPLKALKRLSTATKAKLPQEVARVVAGDRKLTTLGRPDAPDVFVVDADDIAGLNAAELAKRLTIPPSDSFTVIRFPTPDTGLASPVFRENPGFVPGGLTRGGAREYVIPNGPIPGNANIEVVK